MSNSTLTSPTACRLCGSATHWYFRRQIMNRHEVDYRRCDCCDLIQTEQPYWLDEAYSTALTQSDTGAVRRSLMFARVTRAVAWLGKTNPGARGLDFGGGHGLLTRLLRDEGLDFGSYDPQACNLLARGFDADPAKRHELVTCFEVIEHFDRPAEQLEQLLAPGHDIVLISTMLHRGYGPRWWYYGFDHGQHVALYSRQTMRWVGQRYGYRLSCGSAFSLLVKPQVKLSGVRRFALDRLITHARGDRVGIAARLIDRLAPHAPSRTEADARHHRMPIAA